MGPGGDAHAGGALDGRAVERECMRLDLFPHALGERHAGVEDRPRQEQEELLAAESSRAIDLAYLVAKNFCKLLQYGIAGLVAVGVVHALEAIQVTHHAGERLVQALRVLEHLLDPFLEVAPVVEARERVGLRHVPQPFVGLEQLAFALLQLVLEALDAQHRREPRLQLGEVDRLRDVVVGTGLESLDLVLRRIEGRLHDDRDEREVVVAFDAARDFDPVDLGHHDVEQDQIRVFLLDLLQRFFTVARRDRRVAPRFEPRLEQFDVVLVVVDDQNAAGMLLTRRYHHFSRGTVGPRRPRPAAHMAWRDSRRSPLPSPSRDPTPARAR